MNHNEKTISSIEAEWHSQLTRIETATFGMGCFWGPDARFGHLPGIIRTRVGFAGGTKESPTYRSMGDHTETIEVDFNPEMLSFEEILHVFWNNHTSTNRVNYKERQYMSILFYHDEQQKEAILNVKKELEDERKETIETEVVPYSGFALAEAHHQKYYLKRFSIAIDLLNTHYPSVDAFTHSTLIARLNGFVREFGTLNDIKNEVSEWNIREDSREIVLNILKNIRW
ncbi:peptide-methionine (S)-S-oxide reductase MsrA [Domibacillus mangrovi]|uniref:peptide-methionine (S)-S-oxide reductase n=1 Tax=Domibacillus mangrovi TaxID=1714354 RepID=A0A1Q5P603_9BACI|nr:peptide-methionine (S)-S-oxide reductase MsrA [Domibacillus mangrovi]OKL37700.1 peptide-methionine (S)-S-oxide reductase [Domibacillus mangrovi]